MGHPRWANSALCHHQNRHATCGRNQPEHGETRGSTASPAWQHSTSREMGWTGQAACRSCHQPGLPGERQAGDSELSGKVSKPGWQGRAGLELAQCHQQVLLGDAIGVFPNPGAEKMCHDTHQYQWGTISGYFFFFFLLVRVRIEA